MERGFEISEKWSKSISNSLHISRNVWWRTNWNEKLNFLGGKCAFPEWRVPRWKMIWNERSVKNGFILSFFLSSERNRNSSWLMKRQDEAGDGVKTLTQWRIDAMQKVKQAPYQVLFVIIFTVTRTKEPILFLCEALLSTPTLALKALICYQWSLNLGHSPALPALICWDNWPKIIAKLRCEHSSWLQFETSGQSYKAHYARKLRR